MASNTIIRKATSEGAGRRCHMVQRPSTRGEWNKKQKAKQRELRCLPPFFLDTKMPFTNQTKFILLSWYNLNQKI